VLAAQHLKNVTDSEWIAELVAHISDLMRSSARAMLAAVIVGKRDPQVQAELALGQLRPKIGSLRDWSDISTSTMPRGVRCPV
jgi:hypothetical protein